MPSCIAFSFDSTVAESVVASVLPVPCSRQGGRAAPPEHSRYTANHMLRMKELLEGSSWEGGVALGVDICHIR